MIGLGDDPRTGRDPALDGLTRALQEQIPMARFLGIAFAEFEADRIVLEAPLEPSLNHRGTAFGPGVFTAISLAPWLLLVRRTWSMRLAAQILLRRCEFTIHRPIATGYRAECESLPVIPAGALSTDERVRLSATSQVRIDDGEPAATYTAHFTLIASASKGHGAEGDLQLPFPEEWRI